MNDEFDFAIYEKSLFSHVMKDQLLDFLNIKDEKECKKTKKPELVQRIKDLLGKDELARRRFYKTFAEEISLSPATVEGLLKCTRTERLRWTSEGKLPVVCYDSWKYGDFPCYDRWALEHISQEKLAKWREEHAKKVKANRAAASAKAKETKKKNKAIRSEAGEALKKMLVAWSKDSLEEGAMLELAFWTMWASRWAKLNELKKRRARTEEKKNSYAESVDAWYSFKDDALRVLSQSLLAKVSFYRPENPDKVSVFFCEEHMEEIRDMREWYGYFPVIDAFYDNPKKYRKCPNCIVEEEKDYYSLYYIEIAKGDFRFSFHVPYSIGKEYLPDWHTLPQVSQEENEGVFRFGRPISEDEMIVYTERKVSEKLDVALEKAKRFSKEKYKKV